MDMEHTIEELEQIVFEGSITYEKSTAFVVALDYVKRHDTDLYERLLKKEIFEMGIDL